MANKFVCKFVRSWTRLWMSLIGVLLLGVVVALITKAQIGTDPCTDFITGLANLFHTTYSVMYPVILVIFLVVVFFWDKHYIGINTVINICLVGTIAGLVKKPLDYFLPEPLLYQRIILFAAGFLLLSFCSSLYMAADLGVSSYDAFALIISKKTNIKFRWCRIGTDLICVIVGFIFHADVGVGTVITALCMGPTTQWCMDHIANPILKKEKIFTITKEA